MPLDSLGTKAGDFMSNFLKLPVPTKTLKSLTLQIGPFYVDLSYAGPFYARRFLCRTFLRCPLELNKEIS